MAEHICISLAGYFCIEKFDIYHEPKRNWGNGQKDDDPLGPHPIQHHGSEGFWEQWEIIEFATLSRLGAEKPEKPEMRE